MSFELTFRRKVITLSGILGVLAVTFALGVVFSPESVHRRAAQEPLIPILNKEAVRGIRLTGPDGTVQLKKDGQNWTVQISGVSFPAQQSRVDSLLDMAASLKKSRVVASGENNWAPFEVGPDKSRRLQLEDGGGKVLVDLHVGKAGDASSGSFVRLEGAQEVVQVDRSLDYYVNSGAEFWSDLRLFPRELQGQDLIRIGIDSRIRFDENGKESAQPVQATMFLDKAEKGPVWKLEGAGAEVLSDQKVEQLANSLAGFEGTRFVADLPADQAGFDRPTAEVLLTTSKDVQYRLLVGKADPQEKDQYYVRLDGQTYSYLAPAWRIHEILRGPEAFSAEK